MGKYVGIDLGTTFSVVAVIDEKGNPQVLQNKEGGRTTPSVVIFGGKTPVVGEAAKEKSSADPSNYEAFVKRHMGEKTYSFTSKNGETFRAEEISALILSKLKRDAEEAMGDTIEGAVITVPAYFADPQRQATQDAATAAGIPVIGMINEPTAAAIAFGITKSSAKAQTVMIYDFGGGTFDVSILNIDEENITVLATNGNHQLGGYDLDMAIYNYVIARAREKGVDIEQDPRAAQSLKIAAEKAKKSLSSTDEAEICVYVKGEPFSLFIDRETFEKITESIIDSTLNIMQITMDEAGLEYTAIDKILLVGGSTRIPVIKKLIEEETGIIPSSEVHPDEAVAIGAAYHAVDAIRKMAEEREKLPIETKGGEARKKEAVTESWSNVHVDENVLPPDLKVPEFQDVTSHAIGVVVYDEEREKDVNSIIMEKNTPIPAEYEEYYTTMRPYQEEIELSVTSGEYEDLDYVTIIGNAVMKVRPRENKVPIKVIVSCDRNAILHVRAVDMDALEDLGEITINREAHNMTEEEVKQATRRIHQLNIGK